MRHWATYQRLKGAGINMDCYCLPGRNSIWVERDEKTDRLYVICENCRKIVVEDLELALEHK